MAGWFVSPTSGKVAVPGGDCYWEGGTSQDILLMVQKSGFHSPVEGQVVYHIICKIFYIQTVVLWDV